MDDGNRKRKKEDDNEDVETVAMETSKAPDGGWGWCIILGILILRTVIGGFVRSHGLFYLRFKERFGGTATATSLVTSLSSFMRLSTGPIVSILSGRFQCRIITAIGVVVLATGVIMTAFSPNISFLYFSYGIVSGFGRSLVLTPCPILLGYYFDKRRSLAFGIASAGFSIGGFALTPLVELLFQEYGIQGTFLILTAMSMHIFISCTLFRPIESNRRSVTNSKNKNRADTEAEYDKLLVTSTEVCKRPDHAYHETSNNSDVLNSGVLNSDVLNSDVLNNIQAATLMSINAASDTVFRVISGFVLDLKMFRNNRPIIYNIITFFQAATLLCFPFMQNFSGFTFLCGSVVLIDILGVDKMASSLAVSMAVQCFAVIIGPTVSGRLVDIYDGYSGAFFFGGGALFVGGLILVVGNVINTLAIKREQRIKNTDLKKL
ncbi:MOT12-like protein [Mya arenaria]|uniref:MOT12-like protein n=1 Tax=Mya arenaria TaxID=6604 RepID=A0ABY7GEV5_MYAAR|nr:MOT12-like protein [Mya arenaria]